MKFTKLTLTAFTLFTASTAHAYLTKPPPKTPNPPPITEVKLEAKGSHGAILQESENPYYLLVTLATSKKENAKKLPLNIAIVIDRSGSMADQNKLTYAKQAARDFINKLDNEDRLSLVEYDEQITVMAEPTLVGTDRSGLLRGIDLLEPRGSTNLAGGMMEGGKLVEKFMDDNRINRVLLLSDGLANTGVVQIAEVAALAEGLSRKGVQVTTFGLGADFDEEMLTRVSDASGGNYYFIEGGPQIAGIFDKERHALTTVVGKKALLEVELGDGIDVEEVFGYDYKKKGGRMVVDLPDIYSGQNRKVLFLLKPKIKEATRVTVAHVRLKYKSIANDLIDVAQAAEVNADVTRDKVVFEKSVNKEVMVESTKIAAAKSLEEALKKYAGGSRGDADSLLNQARGQLNSLYQSTGSPALLQQLRELDAAQGKMKTLAPDSEEGKLYIKGKKYDSRQEQQSW